MTRRSHENHENESSHCTAKHTYPQWHNGVAGGVAGAGARFATAPLDLVRIRRQLDRNVIYPRPSLVSSFVQIAKEEGGVLALFRGSVAATYLWVGYAAVQFATYGELKKRLEGQAEMKGRPTLVAFLAGGTAGACSTISTYPFDVCRTIFAARGLSQDSLVGEGFKPPKSLHEFALSLYRKKGLRTFYAGCGPATIQIVPYMGTNFAIYDRLTNGDRGVGLSAYAGTISGSISKILVYPMDTIKKRLQAQAVFGPTGGSSYTGMVDCIQNIHRYEGVTGFYRGLVPSVLKTGIATGLSFSLFRGAKNLLEAIDDDWKRDIDHQSKEQLLDR